MRRMNHQMQDFTRLDPVAGPVALAAGLGPAIDDAADEIERTRRLPKMLLDAVHDARLCRMLLPRSAGGDEVEPWVYLRAIEALGRHDASVAWNLFVANSSALIAAFVPIEAARAIYADPRAVIAWGPPNANTARAVPGGYVVTGQWEFASGCRAATFMGAHCQVVEPDGSRRLNAAGRPTVRTLLFPVNDAIREDTWNPIGLRGTASDSYSVSDVFVAEAFSGTREDPTLRQEPGRLYAFPMQGIYAVGVAGVAMGVAQAMLDAFFELAGGKVPRGQVRLAESSTVQAEFARSTARLGSARAWLIETLKDIWETAEDVAPIDIPSRARVRLACAHAIQTASDVADYAFKAAGTDAIFPGSRFERRFRDIHTLTQQIQSRTAHFEAAGGVMFGIVPSSGFL